MAYFAMNPRFSVIVPLYNKAPFVKKALESIISQTFTDWECIIVDDGSTDNSAAICEEFLHPLTRSSVHPIRLFRQPNSGVAKARNIGVENSHGEYLCFLDADDWWKLTFLEELDKLISEYPDAGIYCTNYVYYKPGKTHVALNLGRGYMNYPEAYLHSDAMPIWTGAACMPRIIFDEMGGFPVGIKLGEDFLLWAKTALHYKVAFCEKALAYYNNDVPASLRATRNLHVPKYHMLFHLDEIEELINRLQYSSNKAADWKSLLDKLRISGLMDYWMSDAYHDAAAAELEKVNWPKQSKNSKAQYEKPMWLLKAHRRLMQVGSYCKQRIINVLLR